MGHLARFSRDAERPVRHRRLAVFDKRRGLRGGLTKADQLAVEKDLYAIRTFDVPDSVRTFKDIFDAVFAPSARDPGFEIAEKAELERRGIQAIEALIDQRRTGLYFTSEDERAALIAYVGLLVVQHPTAIRDRAAAVATQFRAVLPPALYEDRLAGLVFGEGARGAAVLATAEDSLATGLELNQLSLRVLRRHRPPLFVLGDNAVVAFQARDAARPVNVADPSSRFVMPLDPQQALLVEAGPAGRLLITDIDDNEGAQIVAGLNRMSWMRAAREVYAAQRPQLLAVAATLEGWETGDHSRQLLVRQSVLPRLEVTYEPEGIRPEIKFPTPRK